MSLTKGIDWIDNNPHYKRIISINKIIREHLKALSISCLLQSKESNPAVLTINLPNQINSFEIVEMFLKKRILINYHSKYLRDNNWIQICLMG